MDTPFEYIEKRRKQESNKYLNDGLLQLFLYLPSIRTRWLIIIGTNCTKIYRTIKTQTIETLLMPIIVNGFLNILDVQLRNGYNTNSITLIMHLYIVYIIHTLYILYNIETDSDIYSSSIL